jgi:hypothetical protein
MTRQADAYIGPAQSDGLNCSGSPGEALTTVRTDPIFFERARRSDASGFLHWSEMAQMAASVVSPRWILVWFKQPRGFLTASTGEC